MVLLPKARRVRALGLDRRSEYKTFADWIKSSTEDLTKSPLPSKRELKKLVNFEVVGGGGGGLLGLLGGLGGIGLGQFGLEGFLGDKIPKIKIPYRRPNQNLEEEIEEEIKEEDQEDWEIEVEILETIEIIEGLE